MEHYTRHKADENLAELAWENFWLSALELKRVLDELAPFDFVAKVKSGGVLLVGEGNLSFSLALSRLAGTSARNMTSTTFQSTNEYPEKTRENALSLRSRGVNVMAGVDATNLSKWFGRTKFGLIVFQFPNVGSRSPLYGRNPNHILVRRFLRSAADHLETGGKVAITAVNSPHYDGALDVNAAATRNEYEIPVAYPFHFSDYPSYTHVKTKEDGTSVAGAESDCVTYVFERKRPAGRKWILR